MNPFGRDIPGLTREADENELQFIGDSSCIAAARFKRTSFVLNPFIFGDLTIQFQDGNIYTYHRVPRVVWKNLLSALSKGWYFNKYIRNNYSFN